MIYKISEYKIVEETPLHIPKYKIWIAKLFNISVEVLYNYRANLTISSNQPYMISGHIYMCGMGVKWMVVSFDNWTAKVQTVFPCHKLEQISDSFILLYSAHPA